jgi:Icc-related predicted phosphoesterase
MQQEEGPSARLEGALAAAGWEPPSCVRGVLERLSGCERLLLPESRQRVRFVHVSDTHGHHREVIIPRGDVLLHTGDLIGNYCQDANLAPLYEDVVLWLRELSERFDKVIVIGGNHDTPLEAAALRVLSALTKNCHYLNGEGDSGCGMIEHRGLRIWGCPISVSRAEAFGVRYVSDAFERTAEARRAVWSERLPDGVDVLLTHVPPAGILAGEGVGCVQLSRRLMAMERPPRVHCFGHDHSFLGCECDMDQRTAYLNGAQLDLLRCEKRLGLRLGGCALVFDLEARSDRNELPVSPRSSRVDLVADAGLGLL